MDREIITSPMSPAEPLKPDMNARLSSQCARYSLESKRIKVTRKQNGYEDAKHALILARYNICLHTVVFLVHKFAKTC